VDDQPIFRSDLDRYDLLHLLRKVTKRVRWHVVAWCFMTTHYHLLVVAPAEPRISLAMQTLNSAYARRFNQVHGRRGHVFGARFTDTTVETDDHLAAAAAYILENPVRAGLVRGVDEWPWSGDAPLERRHDGDTLPEPNRNILVRRRG
jgi:REP element-mobilizing transposase RayT